MSQQSPKPQARVYRGTPRNLARLARALRSGDLVAVPTETVYGLAGDALNVAACRKIFKAKGRPTNDPLIVHIHDLRQLDALAEGNASAEALAQAFWPGPLTMVLPKKPAVPDLVTSGRPSVAVRMPRHPVFRALLKRCGLALAAPSANPFGYISPTSAQHVRDSLGSKIRYILEGGESVIGLESTIVDLRDPRRPVVLRPGAISAADIGGVLKCRVRTATTAANKRTRGDAGSATAALAPGMLARHYSPHTPVTLHARLTENLVLSCGADEAVLFLFRPKQTPPSLARKKARGPQPNDGPGKNVFWLADRPGDLASAAQALFAMLRTLDQGGWRRLHAELAPGGDALAVAINDRLSRAAAKRKP